MVAQAANDFTRDVRLFAERRFGWWPVVRVLLARLPWDDKSASLTTALMNSRNKTGESPLGWVLKYAGSGKLSEEGTLELMRLMVAKGANVTTKAFAENVSWALVPLHPVLKCAA